MEEHEGKYFALWYGVLNVNSKQLRCAAAFHPPAIGVGKNGIKKLGKKDIMLGAFEENIYENEIYDLSEYNKIFLFSDGCFEIIKENGENYEFDEFINLISEKGAESAESLELIFSNLETINRGSHFDDDYSMIEITLNSK